MKKIIILIISLVVVGVIALSLINAPITISSNTFALDTLVEIKIYDKNAFNENKLKSLTDESFSLIRDLEDTLSLYKDGSDIYNLMINAGSEPIQVADITYEIVEDSFYFSYLTNGLFDITSGPLIDLWAIDPPNGHIPTEEELSEVLPLIDYSNISLMENNEILLNNDNMIVNLGAIAKGAIADEVKKYLLEQNVKSAIINLGGNVLTIGNKIDGSYFHVGIQNPFDDRNYYIMNIPINDMAVVTSGDYERYFEVDGIRYHHILDTSTGYPADNEIKQVTIVAPTSIMADGLSTSVLLMGLQEGIAIVEGLDDVEAIFITKDKEIYITKGLQSGYELSEDFDDSFTIIDSLN